MKGDQTFSKWLRDDIDKQVRTTHGGARATTTFQALTESFFSWGSSTKPPAGATEEIVLRNKTGLITLHAANYKFTIRFDEPLTLPVGTFYVALSNGSSQSKWYETEAKSPGKFAPTLWFDLKDREATLEFERWAVSNIRMNTSGYAQFWYETLIRYDPKVTKPPEAEAVKAKTPAPKPAAKPAEPAQPPEPEAPRQRPQQTPGARKPRPDWDTLGLTDDE